MVDDRGLDGRQGSVEFKFADRLSCSVFENFRTVELLSFECEVGADILFYFIFMP